MIRNFLAALQFLTLFPLKGDYSQNSSRKTTSAYFPIVGLLIGFFLCLLDYCFRFIFPPLLSSACLVASLFLLTGGLHLDGLADTADGIFSNRSREESLRIMKDPTSGPMGVCAVVSLLILKFAGLTALPESLRLPGILIMPIAGRCALTMTMGLFQYIYSEGSAKLFSDQSRPLLAFWAGIILLLGGWIGGGLPGFSAATLSLVACFLTALFFKNKIGGYSGDTLGAVCELTEVYFLLGLTAGFRIL